MPLIVPIVVESQILRLLTNNTDLGFHACTSNLWLKLYHTDSGFNNTCTLSDITELLIDSGYAARELWYQTWSMDTSSNIVSTLSYDSEQTFTFTAALDTGINGYFVTNTGPSPQLLYFERFSNPYTIAAAGNKIKITLNLSLD